MSLAGARERVPFAIVAAVIVTGALAGCSSHAGRALASVAPTSASATAPTAPATTTPATAPSPAAASSLDAVDAALATVDGALQQTQTDLTDGDQSAATDDTQ